MNPTGGENRPVSPTGGPLALRGAFKKQLQEQLKQGQAQAPGTPLGPRNVSRQTGAPKARPPSEVFNRQNNTRAVLADATNLPPGTAATKLKGRELPATPPKPQQTAPSQQKTRAELVRRTPPPPPGQTRTVIATNQNSPNAAPLPSQAPTQQTAVNTLGINPAEKPAPPPVPSTTGRRPLSAPPGTVSPQTNKNSPPLSNTKSRPKSENITTTIQKTAEPPGTDSLKTLITANSKPIFKMPDQQKLRFNVKENKFEFAPLGKKISGHSVKHTANQLFKQLHEGKINSDQFVAIIKNDPRLKEATLKLITPQLLVKGFNSVQELATANPPQIESMKKQMQTLSDLAKIRKECGGTPSVNEILQKQTGIDMLNLSKEYIKLTFEPLNAPKTAVKLYTQGQQGINLKTNQPVERSVHLNSALNEFSLEHLGNKNHPRFTNLNEANNVLKDLLYSSEFQQLSKQEQHRYTQISSSLDDYVQSTKNLIELLDKTIKRDEQGNIKLPIEDISVIFNSKEFKSYLESSAIYSVTYNPNSRFEETDFNKLLNEKSKKIRDNNLFIGSYLIRPIQDSLKFNLLLEGIGKYGIKQPPVDSKEVNEFSPLESALKSGCGQVNETKRLFEQFD
jgi:hypothetical protein